MSTDVRTIIDNRWDSYIQATQTRDTENMYSIWAEDARFMEPGMDLSGPDLHVFMREFWEKGGEVFELKMNTLEVFDHGDTAYQLAQYEESFRFPGGEPMTINNVAFFRWVKQADGDWKLHRMVAGPKDGPEGS